jgi:hypothetical protein
VREKIRADGAASLTAPTAKATPNVRSVITLVAIFLGAFILAQYFATLVELPFSNPNEIVGTLTEIRYNPSTSIVRFLLIVLLPTFALTVAFFVLPRARAQQLFPPPAAERNEAGLWIWRQNVFVPVLIVATFLVALDTKSYLSVDSLENFEEGQTLSAGMSYLNGGVPYRDFSLFHGLYDEPLRTAIAFKLFGPSIGAMRTFHSINKIITFGFLAWFLMRLFHRNPTFVLLVLVVLHRLEPGGRYETLNRTHIEQLHSIIIMPRDLMLFAFLTALTFLAERLHRHRLSSASSRHAEGSVDKGIFWLSVVLGALPGLGFIHSMERGVYLLVAFTVIVLACYFFFFRGGPTAKPFLAGCVAGFVFSAALLTILIRGAFDAMLRILALVASTDIQLGFAYPYPFKDVPYVLISLMMAFNCFWVFRAFFRHWRAAQNLLEGIRNFMREHFMEAAMLLLSMLYYRNALGRADFIHVAYVLSVPTILFLFIALQHFIQPILWKTAPLKVLFITGVWMLIAMQGFLILRNIPRYNLFRENFPLAEDDARYLPDNWKGLVSFLRANLSRDESFYTLTDEISIYYFVGKVCPVRFQMLHMVVRNEYYQRQIITDLEAGNVKFVVADFKSLYYRLDGTSHEQRAPLVFDYIREHYQQYREIDGQVILIRKG